MRRLPGCPHCEIGASLDDLADVLGSPHLPPEVLRPDAARRLVAALRALGSLSCARQLKIDDLLDPRPLPGEPRS